ncbi:hypothetical protein BDV25DRAFT_129642 [Aspergillus avenaceus]|uniref:Mid2 domain-containing protein n=1 Tax=Aspergillus avenaceus TaxID=36643 RepID=A0A5N6TVH0_ASPAV|nr:hypothetical protein BDV25DRAFT_129642 [Aspergillus avenaceus]
MFFLLLPLLPLLLLTPSIQAATCYWRNGQIAASEQQPCFPDKKTSPCCGINKSNGDPDDICLSNGLCLAQVTPYTGLVLQNTCTDAKWGDDCLNICPQSLKPTYGIHILPCPDISLEHWCCSGNGSNCCDDAFKISMGTVVQPTSSSSSTGRVNMSTATATATATVTADGATTSCSEAGTDPTTTVAVGAGVGAGLGACLAATVVALLFQRRLYRRKLKEMKMVRLSGYPGQTPPAQIP